MFQIVRHFLNTLSPPIFKQFRKFKIPADKFKIAADMFKSGGQLTNVRHLVCHPFKFPYKFPLQILIAHSNCPFKLPKGRESKGREFVWEFEWIGNLYGQWQFEWAMGIFFVCGGFYYKQRSVQKIAMFTILM